MELSEINTPSASPSVINQGFWFPRSNSITQSATRVICIALKNVTAYESMSYLADGTEKRCSICLEAMQEEEGDLFTVTACSHTYHRKCIAEWKKLSRKCPCCRGPLSDEIGPTNSSFLNLTDENMLAASPSFQNQMRDDMLADLNQGLVNYWHRNRQLEVVEQDMTGFDIFKNVIICPLGIIYPLLLFCIWSQILVFAFPIIIVLSFFKIPYDIYQTESGIKAICIIMATWILFSLIVPFLGLALLGFICGFFVKTLQFYIMVLLCKMRWESAKNFIVNKTLLTIYTKLISAADLI